MIERSNIEYGTTANGYGWRAERDGQTLHVSVNHPANANLGNTLWHIACKYLDNPVRVSGPGGAVHPSGQHITTSVYVNK